MDRALSDRIRQSVASRLADERRAAPASGSLPLSRSLSEERKRAESLVAEELDRYATQRFKDGVAADNIISRTDEADLTRAVLDALFGFGPLQPLLDDDTIENININGADTVWVKRVGGAKDAMPPIVDSDEELVNLLRHAALHLGPSERRFDSGSPQLDMRLPDGSRMSAVMDVTLRPAISIRRHRLRQEEASLEWLLERQALDQGLYEFLKAAVLAKKTMVIAGGTNAGKTTLLRALANKIPPIERLVTIEKSLELGLEGFSELHPDVVALEAREANTEGEGTIGMSQLVRRALRMDPDRVIVGEVLGDEVIDMLNAMSQGNDGSLCTIHANSSDGVLRRIATYAIQSAERLPVEATNSLIAGAIDLIVFIEQVDERTTGGNLRRFIGSVREVTGTDGGSVSSQEVFGPASSRDLRAVPREEPTFLEELERHGYDRMLFRRRGGWWL